MEAKIPFSVDLIYVEEYVEEYVEVFKVNIYLLYNIIC